MFNLEEFGDFIGYNEDFEKFVFCKVGFFYYYLLVGMYVVMYFEEIMYFEFCF